jgi:aminopeptidase N
MTPLLLLLGILPPLSRPPSSVPGDSLRLPVTPIHYRLDIAVDYDSARLRGTAAITIRNWSDGAVRAIPLVLYRLMTIDRAETVDGTPLEYTQDVVTYDDFGPLQVLAATVHLPHPLAPADTTTILVRWGGYLLGYAETGMRYIQDRIDPSFTIIRPDARAYPTIAYPSWAANRRTPWPSFTYHASITVPDSLTVANGGRLLRRTVSGDDATFVYESIRPSSRMDFAIARYGMIGAGPVRIFYLPGDSAGAEGVLRAARASLDLFARWFGPPPGVSTLTFLEIPDGWGSQTDVTSVIQAAAAFRDTTRHVEVYHEVSHLWNPAELDTPSPRWNEGLASFLQRAATEELQGVRVRDRRADQLIGWLRENVRRHPEWIRVPLVDYGTAQLTDLSYTVGALFFDLLDRLVGMETFHAIVREYVARYAATGGTTEQLMEIIRTRGGGDVEPLLRDWIYTTGWAERIERAQTVRELTATYGVDAR